MMSLTNALAQSSNTAFVKLLQRTGVKPTVDMAVRLGLRSLHNPRFLRIRRQVDRDVRRRGNLGSFTLGPFPGERARTVNVAATLASGGVWCRPIPSRRSRRSSATATATSSSAPTGSPLRPRSRSRCPKCEQVVDRGLANAMAHLLSKDDVGAGTAAAAARGAGWSLPCRARPEPPRRTARRPSSDTPTTWPPRSTRTTTARCRRNSARVRCASAVTATSTAGASRHGPGSPRSARSPGTSGRRSSLPTHRVRRRHPRGRVPNVTGLQASGATARLQRAGFKVTQLSAASSRPRGRWCSPRRRTRRCRQHDHDLCERRAAQRQFRTDRDHGRGPRRRPRHHSDPRLSSRHTPGSRYARPSFVAGTRPPS